MTTRKNSLIFAYCLIAPFFCFCADPFFVEELSPEQINTLKQEEVRKRLIAAEIISTQLINFIAQATLQPRSYEVYLKRLDNLRSYVEQLRKRNEHFEYITR